MSNCTNNFIKRVIGVTRTFKWTVTTNGAAVPLVAEDLTLQLVPPRGEAVSLPFDVDDNIVSFTWQGDDQHIIGCYSLILWANYGEDNQRRVDIHNFVELIPWSDRQSGEYSDLVEESIELETADFGENIMVVDNLNSTSATDALSANMGRQLNVTKQDVIQDLAAIRSGAAAGAAVKEWAKNDPLITDDATQVSASKLAFNGNIFEQWVPGIASSIGLKGIAGFLKVADISQWDSAYNDRMLPTVAAVKAKLQAVLTALATIEAVIPSQASSTNKLTDKGYVDGAIATNTANFVGTFDSLAELQAVQNPTKNDYGFVIETDAQGNEYYDRYKYTGTRWLYEYKVESTPFTTEQWAAIQSGITAALVSKLSALPTNAELNTALASKQPVINDLDTIRAGAAAGATAYQKPSGGIPKTDLASAVQTSLGKADSAYQKPSGGIPKTDLASGVQASLDKADAAAPQSATYTKTEVDALLQNVDIDVDSALSTTSENPVQNKVVTSALNTKQDSSQLATINGSRIDQGGNVTIVAAEGQTITIDATPTAGSNNAVSSDGVYNVLHGAPGPYDLLQNATLVTGKSINATTGEPSGNSSYSQYRINVTGYNRIYGSTGTYTNSVNVAFYNGETPSSSTYMSEYTIKATVPYTLETFDAAIPQGCVLVVVVFRNTLTPSVYTNVRYGGIVEDIEGLETDLSSAESEIGLVEKELYAKLNAESNNNGYVIYKDGTLYTNAYTAASGVSDFIPANGANQLTIYSGVKQPNSTSYVALAYYSEANEGSFVGSYQGDMNTEVTGTFSIPYGAKYIRLCLIDYNTPAVIGLSGIISGVLTKLDDLNIAPQIVNNPLPIKQTTDALNILLIGSSWGVDTITALSAIAHNIGLSINTGDLYKSGGTISQYLDDIANGGTNTFYYHENGENISSSGKTVIGALQYKNWDIILLMEGATNSQDAQIGINKDFVKFLEYIHLNATNPRVVYGLLSTWTNKNAQGKQATSFERCNHLRKQTGINNIIPVGSALQYLRATSLNDGNDLYRDALHLNYGIGRFTASCALYYAICYPIFGVGLDNCTITGNWTEAGGTETYPTINVSETNRLTCIECAKKANANIFFLPDTAE